MKIHLFITTLLMSCLYGLNAQQLPLTTSKATLYKFAEQKYGTDELLFIGSQYFPLHYNTDGHQYYKTSNYTEGSVFLQDKHYSQLSLKYDIELDEIVLLYSNVSGSEQSIVLQPHAIDSVYLHQTVFIPQRLLPDSTFNKGYYELIYNNNLVLFAKHRKYYSVDNMDTTPPFGKYCETTTSMYLYLNGETYKVNRRRHFLSCFEEHKSEIRRFMRRNKIRYNKANRNELEQLIHFCYELSENN